MSVLTPQGEAEKEISEILESHEIHNRLLVLVLGKYLLDKEWAVYQAVHEKTMQILEEIAEGHEPNNS